jgi:hypothetical protein
MKMCMGQNGYEGNGTNWMSVFYDGLFLLASIGLVGLLSGRLAGRMVNWLLPTGWNG